MIKNSLFVIAASFIFVHLEHHSSVNWCCYMVTLSSYSWI